MEHSDTRGRARPLKVGIGLPDAEGTMRGATARWNGLERMARLAEQIGFDSIWNQDHLLFRGAAWQGPDDPAEAPWECWSVLAALAAVTERVEIGPLVSCTSFRNPALLAKIAETVDEISGGRLVLGLGAGWHEPEYDAFGYPFDHRVSRFAEAIQIIHGLLRTGRVDFDGTFYRAEDCELRPRGPRPGRLPIMIGTTGERMLRITARYADGWNGYFSERFHRPESLGPAMAAVDAACRAEGRDPTTLSRSFAIYVDLIGDAPLSNSVNTHAVAPIRGSTAELVDIVRGYASAGIDHLQVLVHPMNDAGIEGLAPVLEALDRG
jgi:probable F420-dependent oxidoreductase